MSLTERMGGFSVSIQKPGSLLKKSNMQHLEVESSLSPMLQVRGEDCPVMNFIATLLYGLML